VFVIPPLYGERRQIGFRFFTEYGYKQNKMLPQINLKAQNEFRRHRFKNFARTTTRQFFDQHRVGEARALVTLALPDARQSARSPWRD
jgi:hypothetical protein